MRNSRTTWLVGACISVWFTISANATVFEWVPVSASGTHTIEENTILLQSGGQTVTLHFMVSDWDPDQTGVTVGSFQGTVDPAGYLGVNADTPRPYIDLGPLGYPVTPSDGAFQALKVCSDDLVPPLFETFDPLSNCQTNADCPTGFVCVERPDYVYFGLENVPTVTHSTLAYSWSSATPPPDCPGTDRTTKYYGGTLILDVPADAIGTYTIGFVDDSNFTLLNNCSGELQDGLTAIPVEITIACATEQDCDDDNECTDDACELDQTCTNALNYDDQVYCCDPLLGPPAGLTEIDDQNECTLDVCNPSDGSVTHSPLTGADCGGPPTPGDPCDAQDTCNAQGECVENFAHYPTPCGNQTPTDPECDAPDTCDGHGNCDPNNEPIGTECGDPVPTQCSEADSCDGQGFCDPNNLPFGTPCDDELFCTVDERCAGGECSGGQFTCDDDVDCTEDSCDEDNDLCTNVPDDDSCNNNQWCDGEEICDVDLGCVTLSGSVPD